MKKFKFAFVAGVLAAVLGTSIQAASRTLYLLDFDGTIVDDQGDLSAWRTPWILRRIDRLRTLLQHNHDTADLPETIELAYADYRKIVPLLGKGDGLINSLSPHPLPSDPYFKNQPGQFIPGFYAVDDQITFKYYRPARHEEKSYLLRDLEHAIKRERLWNEKKERELGRPLLEEEKYHWQGLAFPLVRKALSQKKTVGDLVLFTARWHADWEFEKFFGALSRRKFVKFAKGETAEGVVALPRIHSLNEPEALQFGRYGLGQRKAAVVLAEAAQLLTSPAEMHSELSPDLMEAEQGIHRKVHTMIVAEDDPRYLDSVRRALEALSGELYYTHKVKFVLLNTGSSEDVKHARWPWRWTVFHKGFGREALPAEIKNWTEVDCETILKN